jgi:hypothetical protein
LLFSFSLWRKSSSLWRKSCNLSFSIQNKPDPTYRKKFDTHPHLLKFVIVVPVGQLLHTSSNCATEQQQSHNTMPGTGLPKCPWEREREREKETPSNLSTSCSLACCWVIFCQISPNDKNQVFLILISKRPTHNIAIVHSEKPVKSHHLSLSLSLKAGTDLNLHCMCKLFKTFSLQISYMIYPD